MASMQINSNYNMEKKETATTKTFTYKLPVVVPHSSLPLRSEQLVVKDSGVMSC